MKWISRALRFDSEKREHSIRFSTKEQVHYFHVPIDEEVQFKVFVVVSVRVDHLLRYLRMKQVFPVNELVMDFEEAHVKEELQNRPEREIKVGCGGS